MQYKPPRPPRHPTVRRSPPPPPRGQQGVGDDDTTVRAIIPWWKRKAWLPVEMWLACVCLAVSAINMVALVWLVLKMRALP